MHLPLNALRAFEVAARHLSFTHAADELNVTQTAVSMQVKSLEQRLGATLFRRLPRGLALTDEGQALLPVLSESFARISTVLAQFEHGQMHEVLTLGVVGTFAVGWLMPRLREFQQTHPFVDLRIQTNNNRVDLAGEGLDYAIRFGDGAWHGTDAERLFAAPLTPLCAPELGARLRQPQDLADHTLLRSYRADEWQQWFAAAGCPCPPLRGFVFDSSLSMAEAVMQQAGIALLPASMFTRDLRAGRLVQPFDLSIDTGSYWLTRLKSKPAGRAMLAFRAWLLQHAENDSGMPAV